MGYQSFPDETGAGVGFACWRDIRVSGQCLDRIMLAQQPYQPEQLLVLRLIEWLLVATFEFYADGEIITTFAVLPGRYSGMPCALVARDKLNQLPVSADQKMRRNP